MPITIKVTQKDIDKGYYHALSRTKCPVSLAMKRVLGAHFKSMGTYSFDLYNLKGQPRKKRIDFPGKVVDFQFRIFHGHKVRPFTFTLPLRRTFCGELREIFKRA